MDVTEDTGHLVDVIADEIQKLVSDAISGLYSTIQAEQRIGGRRYLGDACVELAVEIHDRLLVPGVN